MILNLNTRRNDTIRADYYYAILDDVILLLVKPSSRQWSNRYDGKRCHTGWSSAGSYTGDCHRNMIADFLGDVLSL